MKIKLDENIPGAVAGLLRLRGHDADTVLDESLGGRDDPTVLSAALSEGRLLLRLDRGFGDVRAYPPGTHPGIIVLRPDDQRVPTVVTMVETLVDHHDIEELASCITGGAAQRTASSARRPEMSRNPYRLGMLRWEPVCAERVTHRQIVSGWDAGGGWCGPQTRRAPRARQGRATTGRVCCS